MLLYLIGQGDGTWHVYDRTNEFMVGVIEETKCGPFFMPHQGNELICWTPEAMHKLAYLMEGLKLACEGVDFPESLPYRAN